MAHFILTVNDVPVNDKTKIDAANIIDTLLTQKIWIFREGTPLLRRIEVGDNALIYTCGPNRRYFVADIMFLDEVKSFSENSKLEELAKNLGLIWMSLYINIEVKKVFRKPVEIKSLISSLSFIVDKKNYGLNLRLPVISISDDDYELVIRHAAPLRNF